DKIPVAADAAQSVAEKAHDALDSVAVKISGTSVAEAVQDKVASAEEAAATVADTAPVAADEVAKDVQDKQ
ncbi:MAG: hypothetical protein RR619_04315, partial [Raoultibacter sp.]